MLNSVFRTVSLRLTDTSSLKTLYRFLLEETMESSETDTVKAEKASAMRNYRRLRKFQMFLEACAVVFVLAQSSSYWLPIAAGFSNNLCREIISVFRSHVFVFALFNAIILAVYVLSGRIASQNDAGSERPPPPDLYDEFVTISESARKVPAVAETPPAEEKTVISQNADDSTPVLDRNVAKPESPERTEEEEKAIVVRSFQRTQSVRVEKKVSDESQREFRRSYTSVYRKLTTCGEELESKKKSNTVNQLSNEDFNRTIEAFIAAQKWMQREEYNEERKTERYMALTVCQ